MGAQLATTNNSNNKIARFGSEIYQEAEERVHKPHEIKVADFTDLEEQERVQILTGSLSRGIVLYEEDGKLGKALSPLIRKLEVPKEACHPKSETKLSYGLIMNERENSAIQLFCAKAQILLPEPKPLAIGGCVTSSRMEQSGKINFTAFMEKLISRAEITLERCNYELNSDAESFFNDRPISFASLIV